MTEYPTWNIYEVTLTETQLAAIEPDELDAEDKEILRSSDIPDLVEMASDNREVAKAAMTRQLRQTMRVIP